MPNVNASRAAWATASGAAIELAESPVTGQHVLEIGGLMVATGADYRKMAGLYEFLIAAAPAVITAIIGQVTDTTGARCAICHRDAHRGRDSVGLYGHGHTYAAPLTVPFELS